MKFKFIYTFFMLALVGTLFLSNSNGRAGSANWGNTGAPGDQLLSNGSPRTCQSCHATGDIQVTLDIEVSADGTIVESYIPGETYDVSVRINHAAGPTPDGYGFQMVTLVDSDESDVNGWSAPSANTKISMASNTGRSYAEQNGTSSDNVFTVKWTAPAADSGNVTFYACGNGVDGNGSTTNDGAAINSLQLSEDLGSNTNQLELAAELNLFPNPTQDWLNVSLETTETISDASLHIHNTNGQLLHQEQFSASATWNKTIDVSSYTSGIYLVQIQTPNGILTKKVLKN